MLYPIPQAGQLSFPGFGTSFFTGSFGDVVFSFVHDVATAWAVMPTTIAANNVFGNFIFQSFKMDLKIEW
jgi:hypothetical protein